MILKQLTHGSDRVSEASEWLSAVKAVDERCEVWTNLLFQMTVFIQPSKLAKKNKLKKTSETHRPPGIKVVFVNARYKPGWIPRVTNLVNKISPSVETVNHPAHYGGDTLYETIKVMRNRLTPEEFIGAMKFNVYKYNDRAKHKGHEVENYKKAQFYQNYLVAFVNDES